MRMSVYLFAQSTRGPIERGRFSISSRVNVSGWAAGLFDIRKRNGRAKSAIGSWRIPSLFIAMNKRPP